MKQKMTILNSANESDDLEDDLSKDHRDRLIRVIEELRAIGIEKGRETYINALFDCGWLTAARQLLEEMIDPKALRQIKKRWDAEDLVRACTAGGEETGT